MPSRRIKSIFHGHSKEARVYHREHRSRRGRNPKMHDAREWRRVKEKRKLDEAKRQMKCLEVL